MPRTLPRFLLGLVLWTAPLAAQSAGLSPDSATRLAALADTELARGAASAAVAHLEQALALHSIDDRQEAWTLRRYADALRADRRFDAALEAYQEAARRCRQLGDPAGEMLSLRGAAATHRDRNDLVSLLRTLEAIQARAAAAADTLTLAWALVEEGRWLGLTAHRPVEALERLEEGLRLARGIGADSLGDASILHLVALARLADYTGEVSGVIGRDAGREIDLQHFRSAAFDALALARVNLNLVPPEQYFAVVRAADSLAVTSGDRAVIGLTRSYLALALLERGLDAEALRAGQDAVAILGVTSSQDNLQALDVVARALANLGARDSALRVATRARAATPSTGNPLDLRGAYVTLGDVSRGGPGPAWARRAIAYYDSAASVLEAWAAQAGDIQSGIPYEWVIPLEFGTAMAWLDLAPTIGRERAAREALLGVERTRGLFIRASRDRAAPPPDGPATLDRLRRRRAAALVSTWVSHPLRPDARDTLLLLVLSPAGTARAVPRVLPPDSLAGAMLGIREACCLATADTTRAAAAAAAANRLPDPRGSLGRLGDLVFPAEVRQALAGAREVLVEPDLALSVALFAAAPMGPDSMPFGLRHAFRYVPLLALGAATSARPAPGTALVVGNPAMPSPIGEDGVARPLAALPGARAEAEWVAQRFGVAALTGDDATETRIRAALPAASLLHLATHGLAYHSLHEPRAPFLAFAPDSANDGLLTQFELLHLPRLSLRASLVVLSACESGLGLPTAEGFNGLQRAFLARGAHSVLYSLWDVSDEATALLMRRFYTHWLDDRDHPGKSEALRRARLDLRADPRFGAPRFWAAFQLVGED